MMELDPQYPRPRLVPTAGKLVAGRPLDLRIEVSNPSDDDLTGAVAELTLEVEKGVLISWRLAVETVPAGSTRSHGVVSSDPEWALPLNVAPGRGHLRVVLMSADGAYLNADHCEVPVEGHGDGSD